MVDDPVLSKRVVIMNDDFGGYIDIYPSHAIVKFTDWIKSRRFEINRDELYNKLHTCCGLCYFDRRHTAKVELDALYDDFGTYRERMVMIEFAKSKSDTCRAKVSFRELVEALYFWIG